MSGTFLPIEQSNYNGKPVLLYEFRRGNTVARYASSDTDVVTTDGTNSFIFTACPINDAGVKQKGTAVTDVFEITAPRSIYVGDWFRYTAPSETVYVTVRRFHWGDSQAVIVWLGQVVSVGEGVDESLSIKCQAVSITLKRGGLRLSWQRGCPFALYDQNCKVDKSAWAIPGTVVAIGTDHFEFGGTLPTTNWYPGGFVEWQIDSTGTTERRLIETTSGNGIYPYGQMDGYVVGMAITVYPGCKRTSSWCDSPFGNLDNYGGFEFMPNRTPYDGDSVF